jgi:alpha-tubulin suppressor-like RCC1 family protein
LTDWLDVRAGKYHTLATKTNGTIWAWGFNQFGQLGLSDLTNRLSPVQIGSLSNWAIFAGSSLGSFAINSENVLYVMGQGMNLCQNTTNTTHYTPTRVGWGDYTDWDKVSTGTLHTIALRSNGDMWAWGSNSFGQLGTSATNSDGFSPIQVGGSGVWKQIAVGTYHSVAVQSDGTLWSWGGNSNGQLGVSDSTHRYSPVQVGTLSDWSKVGAGEIHTVATKTNGTLWSWGSNTFGALGTSNLTSYYSPTQIGILNEWNDIDVGRYSNLATKTNGTLWSWGYNVHGQLGLSDTASRSSPVQVGTLSNWSKISCGWYTSFGITNDDTMWGWGAISFSQLGVTKYTNNSFPVKISNTQVKNLHSSQYNMYALDKFSGTIIQTSDEDIPLIDSTVSWNKFSTGASHFVGIKTDGTAWSIGHNAFGQLGLSDITYRRSLTQIGSRNDWYDVYCADYGTMLVDNSANGYTFGKNDFGQLGVSDTTHRSSPVQIVPTVAYASMDDRNTWVVDNNKSLWAAGLDSNTYWTLSATPPNRSILFQVGFSKWNEVSGGAVSNLGIKTDGTLWSWGFNSNGQLGQSNTTNRSSPTQIGTLSNWSKVAIGSSHSLAVKTDGSLWSWGRNATGQLGLNTATSFFIPFQVGALTDWSQVSCGYLHTIAVKTDGTLWSWGSNSYGQLGLSDWTHRSSPVQVGALTDWSQVSCGYLHTIAVKTDGTLWSWGNNTTGQLGLSNLTNRYSPVQVGGLTNWKQVSGGTRSSLAIKTDGTLWSWGGNDSGQLGLNTTTAGYSSPIQVGTLSNWNWVSTNQFNSYATKTDGTLWSWGSNAQGQLGLGATLVTNRLSPVQVGTLSNWSKTINSGTGLYMQALNSDGFLWSVGSNSYGQLGDFYTYPFFAQKSITYDTWKSVSSGAGSTLLTKTDGTLWSTGINSFGALGLNTTTAYSSPVQVGTISTATQVETRNYSSVFILK